MKSIYLAEWDVFARYYELPGSKPTFVYLPGLGTAAIPALLPVAADPALRDHHALLIDYPGIGFSEKPDHFDHRIESYTRVVEAILDQEGIREATIIGHSMGGTIGLMLALKRPEMVARLVMGESNIEPGGGAGSRRIAAYDEYDYMTRLFPDGLESSRKAAISGDAAGLDELAYLQTSSANAIYYGAKALVNLDPTLREKFLALPIPRGFIYGDKTLEELAGATMPDVPDIAEMEQHGIRCVIVENSGHMMMLDNLQGYINAIRACL